MSKRKGIRTGYIINKFFEESFIVSHLNDGEINELKKTCVECFPKKIENSTQVKPFLTVMIDRIIEKKGDALRLLREQGLQFICNRIDEIITRRLRINQKKLKRLKASSKSAISR